eukprot:Platyproteum_vivax@DN7953_c0_g1_i1.p1
MADLLAFDFEADIERQEEERQRLLESQGVARADVASGRGKHSVVCRHWLRNMCIKGDFCDFLHQFDYDRMPTCRMYQKTGMCTESNCPFKHQKEQDGPICVNYFLGYCEAGPRCKKKHVKAVRSEAPEFVPDWYLHLLINNRDVIPKDTDGETEKKIREIDMICKEMSSQKRLRK